MNTNGQSKKDNSKIENPTAEVYGPLPPKREQDFVIKNTYNKPEPVVYGGPPVKDDAYDEITEDITPSVYGPPPFNRHSGQPCVYGPPPIKSTLRTWLVIILVVVVIVALLILLL
ncbi:MAG: hypothetical protein LUC88_05800 [Prevotella sp.]|nr:hypothetical protein [Prevotella sp.]